MDEYALKLIGAGTVAATTAAYFFLRSPPSYNPNFDFNSQSLEVLVSLETFWCFSCPVLNVNGCPMDFVK